MLAKSPTTRKGPNVWGLLGERVRDWNYAAPVLANLPRSDFLNLDSFPLSRISRAILEYKVACGVLPPGVVQYPLAAIASIISLQFIGSPFSTRTFAAALCRFEATYS